MWSFHHNIKCAFISATWSLPVLSRGRLYRLPVGEILCRLYRLPVGEILCPYTQHNAYIKSKPLNIIYVISMSYFMRECAYHNRPFDYRNGDLWSQKGRKVVYSTSKHSKNCCTQKKMTSQINLEHTHHGQCNAF